MAGSLSHITSGQGEFTMDLIDNMGDAHEALEECFGVIWWLTQGDPEDVRDAIDHYKKGLRMGRPLYPEETADAAK
jgi:hypothetical protein